MITETLLIACGSLIFCNIAYSLEVSGGQFIQTVYSEPLEASSGFIVNDFFGDADLSGKLRKNLIEDIILGPAPLKTNTFTYAVHSPNFVIGHPDRNSGINSYPSQFEFSSNHIIDNAASGRMGLGGVMRFTLPPRADGTPRYFMLGDWTIEYDPSRRDDYNFAKDADKLIQPKNHQVSGWFLRNHIDFPAIAFDVLKQSILSHSGGFYLSGELAWSPEMTTAFLPATSLYTPISKFVLCAQDEQAIAEQDPTLIPCVFPHITLNGQSGTVNVKASDNIHLSIDLGVATTEIADVDYFVAFEYQDTFYWLDQNFQWTMTPETAYQGHFIDFRGVTLPSPTEIIGSLPSGTIMPIYFGLDTTQNGLFDPPYRFSSVALVMQ